MAGEDISVKKTEKAIFAAGCFWGVEDAFSKIKGVLSTTVGYTGGTMKNPAYENVCTGKTGHAESVEIIFDPDEVSYDELLNIFWSIHNPTTLNKQGADIGSQYRSAIFFHSEQQKKSAVESIRKLEKSCKFENKVVTEVKPASKFYKAEEYHQKYFKKHGTASCVV